MSKKSLQDVADIVDNEGLGYAVQDYMSADSIEDEELAKLWDEAGIILNKIDKILEPYYFNEIEENDDEE